MKFLLCISAKNISSAQKAATLLYLATKFRFLQ